MFGRHKGNLTDPEQILTARQPKIGSRDVAPKLFLLPRPLVLRKHLFKQGPQKM